MESITTAAAALAALEAKLRAAVADAGGTMTRNPIGPLSDKLPTGGLLVMYDGDAGEPEVTMSPLAYTWDHAVQVEIFGRQPPAGRGVSAEVEALLSAVVEALAADPTLGGAVDWAGRGGVAMTEPSGGGPVAAAAVFTVRLAYATAN